MQIQTLTTWKEFEEKLEELEAKRSKWHDSYNQSVEHLLYRGQRKSYWKLETTLDRYVNDSKISMEKYYKVIYALKPEIERLNQKSWAIPTPAEYKKWLNQYPWLTAEPPGYDYMTILRHRHELPSPLLDWTLDPYVAAFFAFSNADDQSKYVSIYVLQEWVVGENYVTTWTPNLNLIKRTPDSNSRHLMQKAQYTIYSYLGNDEVLYYMPHDKITEHEEYVKNMLLKFNVPSTERRKVLENLKVRKIDHSSLFGSDENSDADRSIRFNFDSLAKIYFPE
jgi:hypothetical protein